MSQIAPVIPTETSLVLQCKNEELKILSFLNNGLMNEVCLTADKFHELMADMQNKFASLFELNQDLRHSLIASGSRNREFLLVHKSELDEMKKALESSKKENATLRQEMISTAAKADQRIAAEIANKDQAVKATIQAGDARVLAAQQETLAVKNQVEALHLQIQNNASAAKAEKEAALQAEKNKCDAAVAAAKQEIEAVRTQLTTQIDLQKKLTNLAYLEGQDNCKMMEFYYEYLFDVAHRVRDEINALLTGHYYQCSSISSAMPRIKNLVTKRLTRPIEFISNITLQHADTQELQEVYNSLPNRDHPKIIWANSQHCENILLPLIKARNTRPR